MLIISFLQLVPGIFALFLHYANGKRTQKLTRKLVAWFIVGTGTASIVTFASLYAILCTTPTMQLIVNNEIFSWMMVGAFISLCLVVLGFYYRKGRDSRLFLPRSFAATIHEKAPRVKTEPDAFAMGFFSVVPEYIFTLPIYMISAIAIMKLGGGNLSVMGLGLCLMLASILPLLMIYGLSHRYNLAKYIKFRFDNKSFFRFTLSLYYLLIACLLIAEIIA